MTPADIANLIAAVLPDVVRIIVAARGGGREPAEVLRELAQQVEDARAAAEAEAVARLEDRWRV